MQAKSVDDIVRLFELKGNEAYLGENISMSEHMLQCAFLAEQAGENEQVIAAALLHDVGHFLSEQENAVQLAEEDLFHQNLGSSFLRRLFPDNVFNAIKYHVDAKRYLCTVEPDYFNQLSSASVHTLKLQGGIMSDDDLREFERLEGYDDILKIRRFDDSGKSENIITPDIFYYQPLLESVVNEKRDG